MSPNLVSHNQLYLKVFICSIFMLPTIIFASGGPAAIGMAMLIVGIFQFVFYLIVFFLLLAAIKFWKSQSLVAALIFGSLAFIPFLHFIYVSIDAKFEQEARAEMLAILYQQRVKPVKQPAVMQVTPFKLGNELNMLVATSVLEQLQAFNHYSQKTIVTELKTGTDCINFETSLSPQVEFRRIILARHAFMRCVTTREQNEVPNAQIRLFESFANNEAPNRYRGTACLAGGNHPLELRESDKLGGRLIDYWESSKFVPYAFPPKLIFYEHLWQCAEMQPGEYQTYSPDEFRFVANALGYKKPEDFSKDKNSKNVIVALSLISSEIEKSGYAAESIVALLGQWQSSPEIQEELAKLNEKQKEYISNKAYKLMNDVKKTQEWYPYLSSHFPIK